MKQSFHELVSYLRQNEGEIIRKWAEYAKADDRLEVMETLSAREFRNSVPEAIKILCKYLEQEERPHCGGELSLFREHGHQRWRLGFDLSHLIRDWGHLNEAINQTLVEFFTQNPERKVELMPSVFRIAGIFFTEATSASVQHFDEFRRAEASSVVNDIQYMQKHFEQIHRARSMILREASHDIRGGLTAIAGASTLMREDADASDPEDLKLFGTIIDESVRSLTDILDSLLDLSRLDAGEEKTQISEMDAADLVNALSGAYAKIAKDKGLEIKTSGPDSLPVLGDYGKLRRIIQNLLVNALKYTQSGHVALEWKKEHTTWRLCISDTGPGMRATTGTPVLQQMEDKESPDGHGTLAYEGEGIGLTIVKRLCSMLRVKMEVESEPNKGTRFILQFPLSYHEENSDKPASDPGSGGDDL